MNLNSLTLINGLLCETEREIRRASPLAWSLTGREMMKRSERLARKFGNPLHARTEKMPFEKRQELIRATAKAIAELVIQGTLGRWKIEKIVFAAE